MENSKFTITKATDTSYFKTTEHPVDVALATKVGLESRLRLLGELPNTPDNIAAKADLQRKLDYWNHVVGECAKLGLKTSTAMSDSVDALTTTFRKPKQAAPQP